jgi:hypothetical protein
MLPGRSSHVGLGSLLIWSNASESGPQGSVFPFGVSKVNLDEARNMPSTSLSMLMMR